VGGAVAYAEICFHLHDAAGGTAMH
jgi:hypothetical protein